MKRKTSFSLQPQTLRWLTKTAQTAGLSRSALMEVIVKEAREHSVAVKALTENAPIAWDVTLDGDRRRANERRTTRRPGEQDRRKE